mmetsp:Transcript_2864/g.6093  ORF Transcript_2864/g.6093 Transcript_2864/m.6093 type:complete len:373 (-) Transcript_2864:59-1177(-)
MQQGPTFPRSRWGSHALPFTAGRWNRTALWLLFSFQRSRLFLLLKSLRRPFVFPFLLGLAGLLRIGKKIVALVKRGELRRKIAQTRTGILDAGALLQQVQIVLLVLIGVGISNTIVVVAGIELLWWLLLRNFDRPSVAQSGLHRGRSGLDLFLSGQLACQGFVLLHHGRGSRSSIAIGGGGGMDGGGHGGRGGRRCSRVIVLVGASFVGVIVTALRMLSIVVLLAVMILWICGPTIPERRQGSVGILFRSRRRRMMIPTIWMAPPTLMMMMIPSHVVAAGVVSSHGRHSGQFLLVQRLGQCRVLVGHGRIPLSSLSRCCSSRSSSSSRRSIAARMTSMAIAAMRLVRMILVVTVVVVLPMLVLTHGSSCMCM